MNDKFFLNEKKKNGQSSQISAAKQKVTPPTQFPMSTERLGESSEGDSKPIHSVTLPAKGRTHKTTSFGGKSDIPVDFVPEHIEQLIPPDIWDSWSDGRRQSFLQLVKSPNAFFYRNRPPGDPQKCGPFTPEEETAFIERLAYFRDQLGIVDAQWGLFAVPIRGRVGYQCGSFYRQLIKAQKIKDLRYTIVDGIPTLNGRPRPVPTPEVIAILEREALDYIKQCLAHPDGVLPQVSPAVWDRDPQRVRTSPPRSSRPHTPQLRADDDFSIYIGRDRKIPEREPIPPSPGRGKGGRLCGDRHRSRDDEDLQCPLYGVLDPMTRDPMLRPAIDKNGFVMDLESWRKVIRMEVSPPFQSDTSREGDLIVLTAENYKDLKFYIVNMPG
jgi:hypothetical protein